MIVKLNALYHQLFRDNHARELVKGGSVAMIYRVLNMVLSYALLLAITKSLGKDGIGVYNLVLAWGGILTLVGALGLNTSLVRFVAEYEATGKSHLSVKLYYAVLKITLPISVVLGAILFFLAPTLSSALYKDASLVLPFQLIAGSLPFLVLTILNVEFIRGWKVMQVSELFRNLSFTVIVLVVVLFAIPFWTSASLPVLAFGAAAVLSGAITAIYIVRKLRRVERVEDEQPFPFQQHLRVSLPMIFTSFVQLINGRIDIIMIGWFYSTSVVGVFGVAFKISMISEFVISALKTIAMPKISELFWAKKIPELRSTLKLSARLIFFSGIPITLILMIWPEQILSFVGEGFEEGANTLRILAIAQFIGAISGLVGAFMNMTGSQKIFLGFVGIAALVNIGLNSLLIPVYGMEGAAVGTLISTIIWNVGGAIYIWKKHRIATFYHPFQKAESE